LRREEQKKQRDAERKKEEEEAKRQRAAGAKAADADDVEMTDKPDDNINAHINDINAGGVDAEEAATEKSQEGAQGESPEEVSSPPKKKKKKDKKRSSKDKDKPKEKEGADKATDGPASVLKKGGRFSGEGVEAAKKSKEAAAAARAKVAAEEEKRKNHIHEHERNVLECSFVCTQDDELQRFNELPQAVRTLLKNMQKVDKNVCLEPVDIGNGDQIWETGQVPFDHTDLGSHVMHTGVTKAFELRKLRGKKAEEMDIEHRGLA
jgi:hypothetical protein